MEGKKSLLRVVLKLSRCWTGAVHQSTGLQGCRPVKNAAYILQQAVDCIFDRSTQFDVSGPEVHYPVQLFYWKRGSTIYFLHFVTFEGTIRKRVRIPVKQASIIFSPLVLSLLWSLMVSSNFTSNNSISKMSQISLNDSTFRLQFCLQNVILWLQFLVMTMGL